jgi:hypothetical protein
LNDHLSAKGQRGRASRGPSARIAHVSTTRQATLEALSPANWPLTPGVFKSLDYADMPQSKQNISQFEPVEVVF